MRRGQLIESRQQCLELFVMVTGVTVKTLLLHKTKPHDCYLARSICTNPAAMNSTYTLPKLRDMERSSKGSFEYKIETTVVVPISVGIALVCIAMIIYGVIRRKRIMRDLEAGYLSGLSEEELSTPNSRATASSGSGNDSSGYDVDVSDKESGHRPASISHRLSTIPEERLSQLAMPEPSHGRQGGPN